MNLPARKPREERIAEKLERRRLARLAKAQPPAITPPWKSIYVVGCAASGIVKIGASHDATKRLPHLASAARKLLPEVRALSIYYVSEPFEPAEAAVFGEHHAHMLLIGKGRQIATEWFRALPCQGTEAAKRGAEAARAELAKDRPCFLISLAILRNGPGTYSPERLSKPTTVHGYCFPPICPDW